jgi:hypothetical protein
MGGFGAMFRTPPPPPEPIPQAFLDAHQASEPLVGKELHVMYHVIVPTEAYANVRFIASQTAAFSTGEGLTLADRQNALERESRGLRDLMLEEAERLRRDLSDRAFVSPVTSRRRTPKTPTRERA